jgi:hypothetical protein
MSWHFYEESSSGHEVATLIYDQLFTFLPSFFSSISHIVTASIELLCNTPFTRS